MKMRGMKSRKTRTLKILAVAFAVLFMFAFVTDGAFARGGFRGGGFRSSSGFRSFGASRSSSSLFSWGSTRPRTATNGAGAGSVGGSRSSFSAQRNLYDTARRNGTTFSSRTAATQAFQSKYASRYSSRFAAQPSVRPSYIPQSTMVDGRPMNIVYNAQYGGYGYMNPLLGHWVMYNALADTAMLGLLMNQNGYWYGAPPMYVSQGPGFFAWAIILFVTFMVISTLIRTVRGGRR